jgi:hypothetical protein
MAFCAKLSALGEFQLLESRALLEMTMSLSIWQ